MFNKYNFVMAIIVVSSIASTAYSADLSKAKGTVSNIKKADPPKTSTTTKPSPVGQPITDYKPKAKTLKTKAPPSPK